MAWIGGWERKKAMELRKRNILIYAIHKIELKVP